MFDLDFDQADGLKRLFRAPRGLQLNLLADAGCRDPFVVAQQLVETLRVAGVSAGIANAQGGAAHEIHGRPVLISPAWLGSLRPAASSRRQHAALIAEPVPARLPQLYAAIKQLDGVLAREPVMVIWNEGARGRERELRRLCETNLARTVDRFLGRGLLFRDWSTLTAGREGRADPTPLEWMSMAVVQRLDGLTTPGMAWAN
ncbi:MAG: hypothetical protein R3E87_01230 [Burkholderiaceae bacterium]